MKEQKKISIIEARVHNLKNISCEIPHGSFCFMTGVSGSGKSSLAFDTIFMEGQRRYISSLTRHAERLVGNLPKPNVSEINGLTPTICIQQKTTGGTPRSTVGTMTEIYDYLRLLFAKAGKFHCPISGEELRPQTQKDIVQKIQRKFLNKRCAILAPFVQDKKGELREIFEEIEKKGYTKIRLDGTIVSLDTVSDLDPQKSHSVEIIIDRLRIEESAESRLSESIRAACDISSGMAIAFDMETFEEDFFSEKAYSPLSKKSYKILEPNDFSFNHPQGMCEECQGLGITQTFDLSRIIDEEASIKENCCKIAPSYETIYHKNVYDNLASLYQFSVKTPWKKLEKRVQDLLLYGSEKRFLRMVFINPNTGSTFHDLVQWRGWIHDALKKYHTAKSKTLKDSLAEYIHTGKCQFCHGSRLKPYPAATTYQGESISSLSQKQISELSFLFSSWFSFSQGYEKQLLSHICTKLSFLSQVGLGYLTLERTTASLSGGEFQRVRLASQLGLHLSNVTYVLDEPSIGLHPSDTYRLITALKTLKDQKNTVIVVEHDELMIKEAEYIIDIGPYAGENGGTVLYQGPFSDFEKAKNSLTSDYVFHRKIIPYSIKDQKIPEDFITIRGITHRNVQNLDIQIPLNRYTAVTGVSGSGKSTILIETVFPALSNLYQHSLLEGGEYQTIEGYDKLHKIIHVDQSPIGRTPRSNPATYIGVFTEIRKFFASLPESRGKGFTESRFSFNTKEGTCTHCSGLGTVCVDMDFLEEAYVTCPQCHGNRYDQETLSITYKGKNIAQVLLLTVAEARNLFSAVPSIEKKLKTLAEVGLDYICLGQSATTLSGGEAQRMKIVKELSRPATEKTVYILDEPSTGLHFHDINLLISCLKKLVEKGHSVVLIEHNMEMVKAADWIIDIGPGAGSDGGKIVSVGTPEQIRKLSSPTGIALQETIAQSPLLPSTLPSVKEERKEFVIEGANTNNLKNISCAIPQEKSVVVIGPSGAGKSSLVFDTLYAEGQRHYVETLSSYARLFIEKLQKPPVDRFLNICPTIAVRRRVHASSPRSTVGTISQIYDYLRILYARAGKAFSPKSGYPIVPISVDLIADHIFTLPENTKVQILAPFPVSSRENMMHTLESWKKQGLTKARINGSLHSLDELETISFPSGRKISLECVIDRFTLKKAEKSRVKASLELASQIGNKKCILQENDTEKRININFSVLETGESFPEITPQTFAFNVKEGMCMTCFGWGILHEDSEEEEEHEYKVILCPSCKGSRLNALASHVQLAGKTLPQLIEISLEELFSFIQNLSLDTTLNRVQEELLHLLSLAKTMGIGYLSLNRRPRSLSTGEAERVEFIHSLGSQLSGILYLLDEPTKGLHPLDVENILKIIKQLVSSGNTVVAIEHDPQYIQSAQHIVELGPGGGFKGGEIVFSGTQKQFAGSASETFHLIKQPFSFSKKKRPSKEFLTIQNATLHNLKKVSCSFPTKSVIGVAGVSGSGKSTLIFDILLTAATQGISPDIATVTGLSAFQKIETIDQKPLGRTNRSDLATFTDLSTHLRSFFAQLPQAQALGLSPSHFSTYHSKGMCKHCSGYGYKTIDLHFLPPHQEPCDACQGFRLNETSLKVFYKGMHLGHLLKKTIDELIPIFESHNKILSLLTSLSSFGLGYLTLGQEMIQLSPGEVAQVKLAIEMAKPRRKKTLYLLDEPTTGLHLKEVTHLINAVHTLSDEGHTVIAIEHHVHFLASCDYIVELGPYAGEEGGKIIAEGPVAAIVANRSSLLKKFL